jgi:thymidine phosphorylase
MLRLGGQATSIEQGRQRYDELIGSGAAAEKFRQVIARQGGDARVVDDTGRLPQARQRQEVLAPAGGFVARMETERIGWASMALGAGRQRVEDAVDPAVGLVLHKKRGERVEEGEPLATLHFNEPEKLAEAQRWLKGAFRVASAPPRPVPLILKTLA